MFKKRNTSYSDCSFVGTYLRKHNSSTIRKAETVVINSQLWVQQHKIPIPSHPKDNRFDIAPNTCVPCNRVRRYLFGRQIMGISRDVNGLCAGMTVFYGWPVLKRQLHFQRAIRRRVAA